jgi:hypothetical protein
MSDRLDDSSTLERWSMKYRTKCTQAAGGGGPKQIIKMIVLHKCKDAG